MKRKIFLILFALIIISMYKLNNQEIIIPTKDTKFYMTKNGDTLSGLLNDTNLTINELLDKNKEIYLLPEQMIILD